MRSHCDHKKIHANSLGIEGTSNISRRTALNSRNTAVKIESFGVELRGFEPLTL